ncbi:DnaT-like ssDNA-binding domain-containing protein [Pectobacterium versatile]|uniref:DnaT-like ssDNA-binding domain-containing protein n=1 Tax=Pectobacterium versatile TaxID=2488639 RepID=UPI002B256598|nr:DnaT-like ssDNA-binding domain-containing protein [Pectobacterium versatile]
MAYEWIKVEVITPDKPEIYQLAEILSIDPDSVLGKLIRLWSWADQQTIDGNANGNATSVTKNAIDRITFFPGFADALLQVGWLKTEGNTLMFPNFERHNGKSSKKRTLSNRRVTEHRKKPSNGNANGNATSVTSEFQKALPEEELEEEVKDKTPHITREENLPPAENNGLPEYIPGIDEPIGKFPMFSDWRPSLDFRQRAALAGVVLTEDYQPTELAGFVMYWQPEGKAFHQHQWDQKLARHIQQVRSSAGKQKTGGNHAEKPNTGESQTVRDIRAAREAWEREQQGVDSMGNHGGNIFESVDEQERADANESLDGASWRVE